MDITVSHCSIIVQSAQRNLQKKYGIMNSPRKHPQPAILNRSLRTGREDNTYSAGKQPGFCYIAEAEFDGSFPDFSESFF
jgi:hypothetical protein